MPAQPAGPRVSKQVLDRSTMLRCHKQSTLWPPQRATLCRLCSIADSTMHVGADCNVESSSDRLADLRHPASVVLLLPQACAGVQDPCMRPGHASTHSPTPCAAGCLLQLEPCRSCSKCHLMRLLMPAHTTSTKTPLMRYWSRLRAVTAQQRAGCQRFSTHQQEQQPHCCCCSKLPHRCSLRPALLCSVGLCCCTRVPKLKPLPAAAAGTASVLVQLALEACRLRLLAQQGPWVQMPTVQQQLRLRQLWQQLLLCSLGSKP